MKFILATIITFIGLSTFSQSIDLKQITDSNTVWYPTLTYDTPVRFNYVSTSPLRCDTIRKTLLVSYSINGLPEKFITGEFDKNEKLITTVYLTYQTFAMDGYIVYPTYNMKVGPEPGSCWYLDIYKNLLPKTFIVWDCTSPNPYR